MNILHRELLMSGLGQICTLRLGYLLLPPSLPQIIFDSPGIQTETHKTPNLPWNVAAKYFAPYSAGGVGGGKIGIT